MITKRLMSLRGDRLKDLRETKGYTQDDLAKMLGVGKMQVWRWETGENDPKGDFISRLAAILETTTDYLLGREDNPDGHTREQDLAPMERELIRAYRSGRIYDLLRMLGESPPKMQD